MRYFYKASVDKPFDTYQLNLAQSLNLSNNANNTITFRIKPIGDAGLTTRNHLLKFELGTGGAAQTELGFTTNGNNWQTITLDFGAGLGSYAKFVLFTDFNNALTGTYLVDDFAGGTNNVPTCNDGVQNGTETGIDCGGTCNPCGVTAPADAAPSPIARNAEDVLSIFTDAVNYNLQAGTNFFPYWGQPGAYIMIGGGENGFVITLVPGQWNSIDIPMSNYAARTLNSIGQMMFRNTTPAGGKVYVDNIYFWKAPVGTFTYYADADSDGYGAGPAVLLQSATAPTGYSVNSTDCNDSSAAINPGATEIADGLDNDCDGAIDEGFPPSTAAPTPPARNAWDVVSLFSGAYNNVTLNELPTSWSQLALAPFSVETIAGNATWKFGGEFLGMVTNYDNGINLSQMTTMHIDYWTPDNKIMIAKLVNTIDGGEANTIVQDPVVTGTWRSVDIPMSQFGASLNKSKITQILLDPQLGGSTVYVDNLYFYRPATSLPTPTLTNFSVPAKIIGDDTFTITPPTSTNNPATFTYTSSNPAVASINRNEITIQGAGTCIITATQTATSGFGSATITATFVVSFPPPTTAAPTPTLPADRVLSIFSNAYTNQGGASYPYWGQPGAYIAPAVVDIATNNTLKLDNLTYQGVQLASTIDVSAMTTLHVVQSKLFQFLYRQINGIRLIFQCHRITHLLKQQFNNLSLLVPQLEALFILTIFTLQDQNLLHLLQL